jgi:hypothetical protein
LWYVHKYKDNETQKEKQENAVEPVPDDAMRV